MTGTKRLTRMFKKKLFWIVSRAALWFYRRAPLFGSLRASIGVVQDARGVLVIRRNDGRGLSFPGGLALPWETDEETLIREIKEETGLNCRAWKLAYRYESHADISTRITVFHVEASGELRASWEGQPEWREVKELHSQILRSQQCVADRLLAASLGRD